MLKIDRKALNDAYIAGGGAKNVTVNYPGSSSPATPVVTTSNTMTSTITLNGTTLINQTVTF
jgi:hypothetical protein